MSTKTYAHKVIAVGGTFDVIHTGHKALLSVAFNSGESVLIGVTSDHFADESGKHIKNDFATRVNNLKKFLDNHFPYHRYEIASLDSYFGPQIVGKNVDAIVVSEETNKRVGIANELRRKKGMKALKAIVIKLVLAEDGKPISSSRIRRGEIDEEGHPLIKGA